MARGINKVILVGNLGQDPETKYTQNNQPVVNVSLATSESWNDKNTGAKQERTEWHRLVFFNKLAEIAGQYLKKGSQVYVEGSLRTRKWQGQDGRDNYTTEIVVSDMQMLGGRGDGGGQRGGDSYDQSAGNQNHFDQSSAPRAPQQQPPASQSPGGSNTGSSNGGFDDDIPF